MYQKSNISSIVIRLFARFKPAVFPAILAIATAAPSGAMAGSISGVYGFGANATGGDGGVYRPVYHVADLRKHAASAERSFIDICGPMDLGTSSLNLASNKTLRGIWSNSSIRGSVFIKNVNNVVIRDLTITSPLGGDGITVWNGSNVIVYKCTLDNCADGAIDMTAGSTNITLAYCKFLYSTQTYHNFVNLVVGGSPTNLARITVHNCWYANGCEQRMVKATNAFVHMFSNYYSTTNAAYCMGAADYGYIWGSDNVFEKAHNPWLYQAATNRGVRLWDSYQISAPTWGGAMTGYFGQNGNYGGWDWVPSVANYSYVATDRFQVKSQVMSNAGKR